MLVLAGIFLASHAAWREISRSDWARRQLDDMFKGASIALDNTENATMSFFAVEVTGDCHLAVKEGGEPRPMFEMRLVLDWKVEQRVDRGRSVVEAKGQIQVTDFNYEDREEPQMKLVCDNRLPAGATPAMKPLLDKLNKAAKESGMPEVSRMLADDFVDALVASVG